MRDCFFEQQKSQKLSEDRPELHMQELRVESTDRALHESSLQLHPPRMELYQANQLPDHSQEREELAMHRIGQKRKSSSRGSYEKSSGN